MGYRIIYTEESEQDLINIYRYIAINLSVPETAKNQTDRIMDAINGLDGGGQGRGQGDRLIVPG